MRLAKYSESPRVDCRSSPTLDLSAFLGSAIEQLRHQTRAAPKTAIDCAICTAWVAATLP